MGTTSEDCASTSMSKRTVKNATPYIQLMHFLSPFATYSAQKGYLESSMIAVTSLCSALDRYRAKETGSGAEGGYISI